MKGKLGKILRRYTLSFVILCLRIKHGKIENKVNGLRLLLLLKQSFQVINDDQANP